mmetsp:Transcript_26406/g.52973  ORF Transcript_26406/g.52973 Transcript_26406/m.52973 type:complete len:117 (-) Transcript_26406:352-702(-)
MPYTRAISDSKPRLKTNTPPEMSLGHLDIPKFFVGRFFPLGLQFHPSQPHFVPLAHAHREQLREHPDLLLVELCSNVGCLVCAVLQGHLIQQVLLVAQARGLTGFGNLSLCLIVAA